ncbi:MAG TPA: amidase [Pseudomonas sp.]|nr:amidase [Pseudomonas sp.]
MSDETGTRFDPRRRDLLKAGAGLGLLALGGGVSLASAAGASSRLPLPEYEQWDALEIARRIRMGDITASEALEASLARADARRAINAFALTHHEMAREEARRLSGLGQGERERLAEQAPLAGVPFALKDLGVALEGTRTTSGCAFFQDADPAKRDSTLVARYRAAGLNIFAKTTTPEFGQTATTESRLYGDTRNPWDLSLSSGGSSGGASAAVAAGILPVAHASDGGGSIRIPASACGLFGLKPSRGRVPMGPEHLEGWMGLSAHHVISRTVRDSAWLLGLTQGAEPGSRSVPPTDDPLAALEREPSRMRIALLEQNPFGQPVHPDCLAAARRAAELCESLGHRVEPAALELPVERIFAGMGVATGTGLLYSVRQREKALGRQAREAEFEPINWRTLQHAADFSAAQVFEARAAFDEAGRQVDLLLEEYDLLLSPVTAAPAPPLGALSLDQPYDDYVAAAMQASPFTSIFNMSGHPAMSVPLYWRQNGQPIGAQFVGRYAEESRLIGLAARLEEAAPWRQRWPDLVKNA